MYISFQFSQPRGGGGFVAIKIRLCGKIKSLIITHFLHYENNS